MYVWMDLCMCLYNEVLSHYAAIIVGFQTNAAKLNAY